MAIFDVISTWLSPAAGFSSHRPKNLMETALISKRPLAAYAWSSFPPQRLHEYECLATLVFSRPMHLFVLSPCYDTQDER